MPSGPSQMFEHGLQPRKGWFQMHALDYSAKLSANVTFDLPRGRVCHVNSVGELETGATGTQMPIFMFSGSRDLDVANPGTSSGGFFGHQAIGPTGKLTGLVATGGFQVETTEYVHNEGDGAGESAFGAYLPNQLLTAIVNNTTLETGGEPFSVGGGMVTNAGTGGAGNVKQFVDNVCGVVTGQKAYLATHGVYALSLWTYYLPGAYV